MIQDRVFSSTEIGEQAAISTQALSTLGSALKIALLPPSVLKAIPFPASH
jgi:hypothetical protein